MPGIDWTYLGALGGDGLESFAATCLRQRHPDARQTRPASGDGGIDVLRETSDGIVVWQIKRFTAPLTAGQKRQVKKSWERFYETHVASGVTVLSYALATPWTPTEQHHQWFLNDICGDTTFPVRWEGEAFFNGLAAEFPATADRYFKGADMLENMVSAKATLAASPIERGDPGTMLESLAARERALREIRDLVSDNYIVDTSTRTVSSKDGFPLPPRGDPAVYHRYEYLGDDRWYVQSVVPKSEQSSEVEPVRLLMKLLVEPGSAEADQVREWRAWGVPFKDVMADTKQEGGPFAQDATVRGTITMAAAPPPEDLPAMSLRATARDGTETPELRFSTREVTHGVVGGGLRVVASTRSKVVEVEARVGSNTDEGQFMLRLNLAEGLTPEMVARDLEKLAAIKPEYDFEFCIEDGPRIVAGTSLVAPGAAATAMAVATDLARLQSHTSTQLLMPNLGEVTESQFEELRRLADIYDGHALERTWERLVLTIDDPIPFRSDPFKAGGALVMTQEPTFHLGTAAYRITRLLATQYMTPRTAPSVDLSLLEAGDELEIVAGDDNRLVIAAVVDDEPTE